MPESHEDTLACAVSAFCGRTVRRSGSGDVCPSSQALPKPVVEPLDMCHRQHENWKKEKMMKGTSSS